MEMWLEELDYRPPGRIFPLCRGQAVVVGRGPGAGIVLNDICLGRRHFEV
jgi:hypothetical protein